jgi:hypothetical protein
MVGLKRNQDDGRARTGAPDQASGFNPVHFRHIEIKKYDIGVQLPGALNRFPTGCGLGHHTESPPGFEQSPQRTPEQSVIVRDHDPDWQDDALHKATLHVPASGRSDFRHNFPEFCSPSARKRLAFPALLLCDRRHCFSVAPLPEFLHHGAD